MEWNHKNRGGWIGLTASHDRRHLVRAVLEGVAFSLKDCLAIIREQGLQLEQIRATGGGASSSLWRRVGDNECDGRASLRCSTARRRRKWGLCVYTAGMQCNSTCRRTYRTSPRGTAHLR